MTVLDYLRAKVSTTARALGADEEGATAAEYVFLLVFIAIVASVGMAALGIGLDNVFQDTGTAVNTIDPSTPGGGTP